MMRLDKIPWFRCYMQAIMDMTVSNKWVGRWACKLAMDEMGAEGGVEWVGINGEKRGKEEGGREEGGRGKGSLPHGPIFRNPREREGREELDILRRRLDGQLVQPPDAPLLQDLALIFLLESKIRHCVACVFSVIREL